MKHVVILGGGTGTATLARGLKARDIELSLIVSMADDGGSTGLLRRELGVHPPGDIRQCLLALSQADDATVRAWSHRFPSGVFTGHSVGNLMLAGLEQSTGSFAEAVRVASAMLQVRGNVIPVTLENVVLRTHTTDGNTIDGEHALSEAELSAVASQELIPAACANPDALAAINQADLIVLAPGQLYGSTAPVLLPKGITDAIVNADARTVYVCNLANRANEHPQWTTRDYASAIEQMLGKPLDYILYNIATTDIDRAVQPHEGADADPRFMGADLLDVVETNVAGDLIARNAIRHNSTRAADALLQLL